MDKNPKINIKAEETQQIFIAKTKAEENGALSKLTHSQVKQKRKEKNISKKEHTVSEKEESRLNRESSSKKAKLH